MKANCVDGWYQYPNITSTYPEFYRGENREEMTGNLNATLAYLSIDPGYFIPGIEEIQINEAIWIYPAYPQPVQPRSVHSGARGVLDTGSGEVMYVHSSYTVTSDQMAFLLEVRPEGFKNPKVELLYRVGVRDSNGVLPLKPLPGEWISSTTFRIPRNELELPAFAVYRVTEMDDPAGRSYIFWGEDNMS